MSTAPVLTLDTLQRKALSALSRIGAAAESELPIVSITGSVTDVRRLRPREYCKGVVFDFVLSDGTGSFAVHLHDEWAEAAAFISNGDEITLRRQVTARRNPDEPQQLILGIGSSTELVVAQKSEFDIIELTLSRECLENPPAKVRSRVDPTRSPSGIALANDIPGSRVVCD